MIIIEDHTVTVKFKTAMAGLFLYFNLCLSVMLDSLLCSFTSIFFLVNPLYRVVYAKSQCKEKYLCNKNIIPLSIEPLTAIPMTYCFNYKHG